MKKFATLALLAAIAYAQDEATEEAFLNEEVAAEEAPAEEAAPVPLPDQAVATDIAFAFNTANVVDSQITQLTETSDPPIPATLGVTGVITAMTDATGAGSIDIELKGYWGAKFQNANSSKDLVGHMALEFRQNTTETSTVTEDDGTTSEVTNQVVKAETVVITGNRTGNDEVSVRVEQWDSSGISFGDGWDYRTPIADFLNGQQAQTVDIWSPLGGSFIHNDESGSSKYWQGFALGGQRPFEGGQVTFENGGTTTVTGATWVTKKGKREFNRGSMAYKIDLAVPVVVDDLPDDNTGDGSNTVVEPTGASALSVATAAAVAVLALCF